MISEESYRLVTGEDISKFNTLQWFSREAIHNINGAGYLIPEKYLIKELDRREFWRLKLDELLSDFDFERVYKVMETLDWYWITAEGVPEVEDMKESVRHLYSSMESSIIEKIPMHSSSGGFLLKYNPEEDEELRLVFEATSYSVYGD